MGLAMILFTLSFILNAGVAFTPDQWACDRSGFGECRDLSQKAAYKEAVRYLKDKHKLTINAEKWDLFCGRDKNDDRPGDSYHMQFNEKAGKCAINIWIDCTTGEVPEKAPNNVDVRCN